MLPWSDPALEQRATHVEAALRQGEPALLVAWLHQEGLDWSLPRSLGWWNAAWASGCPETRATLVSYLTMSAEGQEVLETVYKQACVGQRVDEAEYAYARLNRWPAGERLRVALERNWQAAVTHLVQTMHPDSVTKVARRLMRAKAWPELDRLSTFMAPSIQVTWLRRYPGQLPQTLARRRQQRLVAPPTTGPSRSSRPRA